MPETSKRPRRQKPDHRTRVGNERSARTVSRILEAAMQVLADRGPDATQIEDVVRAAGISRGTFYNHFASVDELRAATSEWTTRETIASIEKALAGLQGPALRLRVGLRLFFAKAQEDPVWCRFVARVWKVGGQEPMLRDLEQGLRLGVLRAPSVASAQDLLLGCVREALLGICEGRRPAAHGARMTELCLRALGSDAGAARRGGTT